MRWKTLTLIVGVAMVLPAALSAELGTPVDGDPCRYCDCIEGGGVWICLCYPDGPGIKLEDCHGNINYCTGTACGWALLRDHVAPTMRYLAQSPARHVALNGLIERFAKYVRWAEDASVIELVDCEGTLVDRVVVASADDR